MAKKKLKPVSIWGIEFDAMIDEQKDMNASIPSYPVENGFPVSDTIINEPLTIQLNLFISNTPVTFLYRHGTSKSRVNKICKQIEKKWLEKKLAKIVTADTIYKNMGIKSISIKKSREIGYAREIAITAQKVYTTKRKTVKIPSYVLKSGSTMANAGTASVSTSSTKSSTGSESSYSTSSSESTGSQNAVASSNSSSNNKSKTKSSAQKSQSVLYGVASGLGFI